MNVKLLVVLSTVLCLMLSASNAWGILVWYQGNVDPDAPDSAGPGVQWELYSGVKQGLVVADPDATNGWAWHIVDSAAAKSKWRSSPSEDITSETGATIVARVKTVAKDGSSGENIGIIEYGGLSCGYTWGGPNGQVKEVERGDETYVTSGNAEYRVIRMTAVGTGGPPDGNRRIRLYLDEDPTPVIDIIPATNVSNQPDAFRFGAGSTAGTQDIYFDWITASNEGAFAPGEEVAVLGHSLVIPEPGTLSLLLAALMFILRRSR
jgi:hypothetical protein